MSEQQKHFEPFSWHATANIEAKHGKDFFIEDVHDICAATQLMLQMVDTALYNKEHGTPGLSDNQIGTLLKGAISAMNLVSDKAETFWTN